ncbi:hypothetical protein BCF11_0852 [Collimonas sp. PA-H2]|uniref:hypothetical protein n=1 Tax=Collimonas sp. PA-H2 TaxID=1881062 RepID=UPI000BF77FFE|nr:hypothetical protein [Collimonas sp. PA-H2]PFH08497.1 hypothetical protein BCF11_0852 [Collimonas sp. PA-H2]
MEYADKQPGEPILTDADIEARLDVTRSYWFPLTILKSGNQAFENGHILDLMLKNTSRDVLGPAVGHLKESFHSSRPKQLSLTAGLHLPLPAPLDQIDIFRTHGLSPCKTI